MPTEYFVIGGVVLVALLILILLFKAVWRVAEPNEALIISGLGARGKTELTDSLGFKIITGKGTSVLPGFQTARRLRLDSRGGQPPGLLRHPAGHPGGGARRGDLQGRRRPPLHRQRRPPLPRPAGLDERRHPRAVHRSPALDHRQPDRRGPHPQPRAADQRDPRLGRRRDDQARPDRRLAADPGDRRRDRLHHQPRQAARRQDRRLRPHRRGPARPGGHRGRAGRRARTRRRLA